jgi:tetratricopeptide (TPR) repeat protein
MGFLKRFNREQLALGSAGVLIALLLGWQLARGGSASTAGNWPTNDRVFSLPRQTSVEFLDPKVEPYLPKGTLWEPPATGRLPVPDLRPPEPRLGGVSLPPFLPRPDFERFNGAPLAAKHRTLPAAPAAGPAVGLPSEADIAALKNLKEPDGGGVVDRRKQLMRPAGDAVVHLTKDRPPVTGRIVLALPDGSVMMEIKKETSTIKQTIAAADIDRAFPGTDNGIEYGHEFGKECARRATKLLENDVEGQLKLGRWCRETAGMLPEARKAFEIAIEALKKANNWGPRMRDAVFHLVETYKDMGDYAGGVAALNEYTDSVRGTANDGADLHLAEGRLYSTLGFHEAALTCYAVAFHLEPARAQPRIAQARAYTDLGRDALALEEISAMLVPGAPEDPEALVAQGLALLRLGQAPGAEAAFAKVVAAQPANVEALNGLGAALALQGKADAGAKFLAAIRANQYAIDAWINLATLYLAAGRPVEAETLLIGAAQRDPSSPEALAGLGLVALLKGAPAEAPGFFDNALKIRPDHYYATYALGRLMLREQKPEKALEHFRASLRSEPSFLPATSDAALAYLALAREEQRQAHGSATELAAARRERAAAFRNNAETLLTLVKDADPQGTQIFLALGCVYATVNRGLEATTMFNLAVRPDVQDPLIEYGRGYIEYWHGADNAKDRLELAEAKFKYGASFTVTDPVDQEWVKACLEAVRRIQDWKEQRILFEDQFTGDQASLTAGWLPIQFPNQPQIRYEKGVAWIGDALGRSTIGGFAALERRDIPRDAFLSAEWTFVLEGGGPYDIGVSLYTGKPIGSGGDESASGLHFVLLEDSASAPPRPYKLFYGTGPAKRVKGPDRPSIPLGTVGGPKGRLRFKLEKREDVERKAWIYDLSIWDEAKAAWKSLTDKQVIRAGGSGGESPTFAIQFWGRAQQDAKKWAFGVDDVRVLIKELTK